MRALLRHTTAVAALLLAVASTAAAQTEVGISQRADDERSSNELDGRLNVSHSFAVDDQTAQTVSFSDVRLISDLTRVAGTALGLHVDGRARQSWTDATDDRLTVSEAYVSYGDERDTWRVGVGRQIVRAVASAEIDGARIERRIGANARAMLFGGLIPHPIDGSITPELAGTGAGYELRTQSSNHAGGAVVSWYDGAVDRAYVTQRSYLRVGRRLSLAGFGIVDFLSSRPLFGQDDSSNATVDLTALNGMVRYQPTRWLDSTVSAAHNHTLLPGKWWQDWLAEKRREIGFELDGEEPVGTRLTSVRWTNNLHLARTVTPYTRLRYDVRHTEAEQGYEARAGLKLQPRFGYVDASYSYRDYFSTRSQLGSLFAGATATLWGGEAGAMLLRSRAEMDATVRTSYDAHAMLWVALGDLLGIDQRIFVNAQYRGLFDPDIRMHTFFVSADYRL